MENPPFTGEGEQAHCYSRNSVRNNELEVNALNFNLVTARTPSRIWLSNTWNPRIWLSKKWNPTFGLLDTRGPGLAAEHQ